MNKVLNKFLLGIIVSLIFLFFGGCTSVVKQNIISSINTGIGATLTENPQTQLYEVKIGYIRSQFYSVPTGKTIKEDTNQPSNAANITADLVSGIRMESGIQHLFLGVDVSENFAVGKVAVMSPAAVAMYISQAESPAAAQAASAAIQALPLSSPVLKDQQTRVKALIGKPLKEDITLGGRTFKKGNVRETRAYANAFAETITGGKLTYKTLFRVGGDYLEKLISELTKRVE